MTKKTRLEKDIEFCIEDLGLNDNQIGEMLRCCEQLGNISSVSYTHLTLPTKA